MKTEPCDCKAISCGEDCQNRHTHKEWWCEHCRPESLEDFKERVKEPGSDGNYIKQCEDGNPDCYHEEEKRTACKCNYQCVAHVDGDPIAKYYKGGMNPIYCIACLCQAVATPEPVEDWEKDEFKKGMLDFIKHLREGLQKLDEVLQKFNNPSSP